MTEILVDSYVPARRCYKFRFYITRLHFALAFSLLSCYRKRRILLLLLGNFTAHCNLRMFFSARTNIRKKDI